MSNESQNPITTPDWRAERLAAIKRLYPDLFTDEGKINHMEIEALITDGDISLGEKFEFRWPGKMQAKRHAFTSSKASLAPDMERSVNFDETKNVIIEGENLEVLKLLSKAYYNKVKCIYIDPPYNTGHDFVYSDDYSEGKQEYWERNGVFRDGLKMDTNSESAGRYHTNWLNMMLPRLLLAQMMLKDDGVIFVSIDDNEVHNLRKLMGEVFGEENFVQNFMWLHGKGKKDKNSRTLEQYILCYAKNKESLEPWALMTSKNYNFDNPDHDPRGPWFSGSVSFSEERSNKKHPNFYKVSSPSGIIWERQWQCSEDEMKQYLKDKKLYFGPAPKYENVPRLKIFPTDEEEIIPPNIIDDVGTTRQAQKDLDELFGTHIFENPKPVALIKRLVQISTKNTDIVMDFFAGSGTTAHAVMELNKADGGSRNFVMVQIPEATEEKSEAYKAGYKKISDITIKRVKRAGERVHAEKPEVDTGFKVFKLTASIFPENTYQPDSEKSAEENVQALKEHIARAKQQLMFDHKGKETDLMYETLIKQGFMLTMEKERLGEFGENVVWKVTDGDRTAIACLDADMKDATIKALVKYKDNRFIGLHRAVDTTKKWELTQIFGEALVLI